MSAWYVWSAVGFYPETPGTTDLALGSPVFAKASVQLPSGRTLTVSAPAAATGAPYVQSMTVDGAGWTHAYLDPHVITDGAALTVALGSAPVPSWAAGAQDAQPSDTRGLGTALGWSDQSRVVTTPGHDATVRIGARNLAATRQTVSWQAANSGAGNTQAGPGSGSLLLPRNASASQLVTVSVPTAEGRYYQRFTLRDAVGARLPDVVVEIDVAKPGSLWPFYNNAGVANDGAVTSASYDGDGWSYSAQALAAQGVTAGATVTAGGLDYAWPDVPPGALDNIETGGQTVPLVGRAGATRFGILGSATNAAPGSIGDFTLTFTDGTTQTLHLGLTDWTLQGGAAAGPSYGNAVAVTTPYRDTTNGGRDAGAKAYLFTAGAPLTAGKTVASVTLPSDVGGGQLHVFAFSVG